jgi:hypothetical protein
VTRGASFSRTRAMAALSSSPGRRRVVTAALTPGSWECERCVIAQWLAGERQPSPSRGISRPAERSITISRPAS